ncbi:MAG: spore germination protein [Clostridia bacterium]|nr:spore germination protein [Clostridia bacterium]
MRQEGENADRALNRALGGEGVCDLKRRGILVGDKKGAYYFINGYVDSAALQRLHLALARIPAPTPENGSFLQYGERFFPFADLKETESPEQAALEVLRGSAVLTLAGFSSYLSLDVRSYASRGIQEPEKDRTLRGPHLGFNENAVSNLVLIRRHLRTPSLRTERFEVGRAIPGEVILVYLKETANKKVLERVRRRLKETDFPALSMSQESLADILYPQRGAALINPFPRVRFTERPDVAAAGLMEGKIVLICDNSPAVMLLLESFFDFFEEADDYYFPPVTATYLKIVRMAVFIASILLIPIWLLAAEHGETLPASLRFLLADGDFAVPLYLQFLLIEVALDGLRMASLNTPNSLSNSFSIIGGLILGDFAVKSGWFVPQTILYSAFTGIANYVPTNYELGYSIKFCRMSLILLVHFFGGWGLATGLVLWTLLFFSTRLTVDKNYLYPLFPPDPKALFRIFFRTRQGRERRLKKQDPSG